MNKSDRVFVKIVAIDHLREQSKRRQRFLICLLVLSIGAYVGLSRDFRRQPRNELPLISLLIRLYKRGINAASRFIASQRGYRSVTLVL